MAHRTTSQGKRHPGPEDTGQVASDATQPPGAESARALLLCDPALAKARRVGCRNQEEVCPPLEKSKGSQGLWLPVPSVCAWTLLDLPGRSRLAGLLVLAARGQPVFLRPPPQPPHTTHTASDPATAQEAAGCTQSGVAGPFQVGRHGHCYPMALRTGVLGSAGG